MEDNEIDEDTYSNIKKIIEKINNSDKENSELISNLLFYIKPLPNKRIKNVIGEKYYELTVVGYIGNYNKSAKWLCRCDCGNYILAISPELKNGHIKSCGCRNLRVLLERNKNNKYGIKHGCSRDRIYKTYMSMIQRCYNKNNTGYKNYGERGIKICDEWLDKENGFLSFYNWAIQNGYEETLTIERIDINGNYEPSNCTWITNQEQQNNKRTNVWINISGEVLNMRQWSKEVGINEKTIEHRKRSGWKECDLLKPVYKGKISNNDKKSIIDLYYNQNYSIRKIAGIFNISHTTISNIIHEKEV